MKLSVFLLSHNKNGWVQEAVASILGQDYDDYELWIIDNSTDDRTCADLEDYLDIDAGPDPRVIFIRHDVPADVRTNLYVPSWLLNQYYPRATGDVILYLSDDDLFVPGIFRAIVTAFEENPDWSALYFALSRITVNQPGEFPAPWMVISAEVPRGSGEVDCCIDGGQVAYRKEVLAKIGQPYFDEAKNQSNHADGRHLQKITEQYAFHPIVRHGVIHRHTPISTWN